MALLQAVLIVLCAGAKAACPFASALENSFASIYICTRGGARERHARAPKRAPETEAQAGARYTAGLAVVAVGGLFAVFAAISRKGRGAARVVKEGYGATDSTVDALLA